MYKFINGGEGGIRTLDRLPYTHFPGVLLRPLGHLTASVKINPSTLLKTLLKATFQELRILPEFY